MGSDLILTLTSQAFDQTLEANSLVLVDFWAEWCAPCRMIAPMIDELAKEYEGKLTVGKVNVDEEAELANRFGIRGIPTLILYKDGKEKERFVGVQTKAAIKKSVDPLL